MPVSNIDIPDFAGTSRNVNTLPSLGRVAAAASLPVTLSTEDAAYIDGLETALTTIDGRLTSATPAGTNEIGAVVSRIAGITISQDITRPADTTQYATNDCWSNSTSAPTSGGYTLTAAARASAGMTQLTDLIIASSNAAVIPLQGEIWIFDTAATNINDNSGFTVSDSEIKTLVAKVPFALETAGANSSVHLSGLGMIMHTVGSANLRFLLRVANDYQPISAEVLTIRAKFLYLT